MSTAQTAAELAELARNADDLRGLLGRYTGVIGGGVSRAEIHVNANAPGVWIAATACLVMLGMGFVGAWAVSGKIDEQNRQISQLQERINAQQGYLNAIYRAAPTLNPDNAKKEN
jgi:hypothetical protein